MPSSPPPSKAKPVPRPTVAPVASAAPPAPPASAARAAPDARFEAALAHLIGTGRIGTGTEGGFNDIAADRGGATNFGISLRFAVREAAVDATVRRLLDMDMDGDVDHLDIRRLSRAAAAAVYRRCFWDRYQCGRLKPPVDAMLFDQAVNGGGTAAVRMLQNAINRAYGQVVVTADGTIGPRTIAHANKLLPAALANAYRSSARARYQDIAAADPSQKKFLGGWLNRADALGRA